MNEKLKSLIPLNEIEPEAMKQIHKALQHDFVKKLVIMPDIHAGYDLPVGSVALTENIISPSFVGYDIGCGMCLADTGIKTDDLLYMAGGTEKVFNRIYSEIPVGFESRKKPAGYRKFISASGDKKFSTEVDDRVQHQKGTLGSGNHFIEIGTTRRGTLAVTIHSGSRNAGHRVCEYYMKRGLYLRLDSDSGQEYLSDMNFMLQFALDNRLQMMRSVLGIIGLSGSESEKIIKSSLINENHNHALIFDKKADYVIHRKGATPAEFGQAGVIPGNMRDGVYVTKGLGNMEFLSSASHGAGRTMSRSMAKKKITLDEFRTTMDGITARINSSTIDEAPAAYKNIKSVIKSQEGVVIEVTDFVKPVINIKG